MKGPTGPPTAPADPAPTGLETAVRQTLRGAMEVFRDDPVVVDGMRSALARFDEPLRIAIAGKVKAGKSTLLNALVGERIAPTDAGECTRVVTWYRHGVTPRIEVVPRDAPARTLPVHRRNGRLVVGLGGRQPDEIEKLVVDWPVTVLRSQTLIDTPGIGSLSTDVSARSVAFLAPEDRPSEADAIVYLLRHLHSSDLNFLESFHDQAAGVATSINAIGVLSRADEIGAGRLDALISAKQVARRYGTDPTLRQLCQTVVPVAGLIAETGRTLRQSEFTALTTLAGLDRARTEAMLLSVDRFVRADLPAGPSSEIRREMLDRFGLFGIRLALVLIRAGVVDATVLAGELVDRSGLRQLRELLVNQFAERRTVLKARSALLALQRTLTERPRRSAQGVSESVQRILAGAHEFRELALLRELRLPDAVLPADAATEAEQLLGGAGTSARRRFGLPDGTPDDEVRIVVREAIRRWRARAHSPLTDRTTADACQVVVRSCEGVLADLSPLTRSLATH